MKSLFQPDLDTPYELPSYSLKTFAFYDKNDSTHVISYSIFPEEFEKPTPVGFIIVKPNSFIVFVYYNQHKDVWLVGDKARLDNSIDTVPNELSILEDSLVLQGSDCEDGLSVYETAREVLQDQYTISSIEPIELLQEADEKIENDRCDSECIGEEFEYYQGESNNDITLHICTNCHHIMYVEHAGLKYTPDDLTIDQLSGVSEHTIDDTKSILIPDESPSFFDSYVSLIWWEAFRQSGGLEKYSPDIQNAVLFTKEDEIVGFLSWNTLKISSDPIVQQVYFDYSLTKEEMETYYTAFCEHFQFNTLLVNKPISNLSWAPHNFDSLDSKTILVLQPTIVTNRDQSIEQILQG